LEEYEETPPLAGGTQACQPVPLRKQATGRLTPWLHPYTYSSPMEGDSHSSGATYALRNPWLPL